MDDEMPEVNLTGGVRGTSSPRPCVRMWIQATLPIVCGSCWTPVATGSTDLCAWDIPLAGEEA